MAANNLTQAAAFNLTDNMKMTEMDRPIQMSGSIATHSSGAQTFTATIFPQVNRVQYLALQKVTRRLQVSH